MARDAKFYWRPGAVLLSLALGLTACTDDLGPPVVYKYAGTFKFSDTSDQSVTMSVEGSAVWTFTRSDPRRGMWMYKASGTAQLVVTLNGCESAGGTVAWNGGLQVFSALGQIPSSYGFSLGSNDISLATVKCGNTTTTIPLGFNVGPCEDKLPYTDVTTLSHATTGCRGGNLNHNWTFTAQP